MRQALLALGALILLGAVGADALAGKPPPPPPPPPGPAKYVYYRGLSDPYVKKMNAWDGSEKTTTPVAPVAVAKWEQSTAVSFAQYNGTLVSAYLEPNGIQNYDRTDPVAGRDPGLPFLSNSVLPTHTNYDLVVQRMDSGTTVARFHDTSFLLMGVAFVPGSPEKIALHACQWVTDANGTTLCEGLFLADFALDGAGNINGLATAPSMVYEAAAPTIVAYLASPGGVEIRPSMRAGTAWLSAAKVIVGIGQDYSTVQLRVIDLATPSASYDLVQGVMPVLNPSGTRVAFGAKFGGTTGTWEVNLDGTGRTLWVPFQITNTTRAVADVAAYCDDDTIVYVYTTTTYTRGTIRSQASYVMRLPRGGTAVNITADTVDNLADWDWFFVR